MFNRNTFMLAVLFILVAFVPVLPVSAEGVWETLFAGEDHQVNSVAVDANNVIWLGMDHGVLGFNPKDASKTMSYSDGVAFTAIAIDRDNVKWFGTDSKGVFSYDGKTWKKYTTENGLVHNDIHQIIIDKDNVKWFGTGGGISSFNGAAWKTYIPENQDRAYDGNSVTGITVDADGVVWCTLIYNNGIFSFDGVNWKRHHREGLYSNGVTSIAADANNKKWFGTAESGVAVFDNITWMGPIAMQFGDSQPGDPLHWHGLAGANVRSIVVDQNNIVWFGTKTGVSSFDGKTWEIYTTEDGLVGNDVKQIFVDKNNVKWFLTDRGVSSFNDRADYPMNVDEEENNLPYPINIRGNFPNPFNPTTTIEFSVGRESLATLAVYNLAGQKVRTLINGERLTAGVHSVVWDGKDEAGKAVSSGTYLCRIMAGNFVSVNKMTLLR
ncbi:MAG: two-component regulator propeller domain-containing protein [Patescibacteria group bacterium]